MVAGCWVVFSLMLGIQRVKYPREVPDSYPRGVGKEQLVVGLL